MSKPLNEILRDALDLPPIERAKLIDNLLASFEYKSNPAIDSLWAEEAENRIDAFDQGELTAIPAEEVFSTLQKYRPQ